MTAQNLLYIENKSTMLAGAKGTSEYSTIMHKLQEESYKHQQQEEPLDQGDTPTKAIEEDDI